MAVNRFNNNMFQFEDFDMSGIMNPELVDVMEMRKEANLARGNATDQYEADVADFKNTLATEAEQGIASLPNAPTVPNIDYTNFNPTIFGQPFITPDFNFDIPELGIVNVDDTISTMPFTDDIIDVDIPVSDSPLPDYPFVDPETGGDYVLVVGDPTNPGPGVVVRDPETGELPPGFTDEGVEGPAGTIPPEVYVPRPPPPAPRSYETVIPFERPLDNVMAGYTRPMDPSLFGSTPGFEDSPLRQQPTGMKGGGRVPMGNNNMLNSGLSRLPLNQQNDTLTQVFQSGFRPRR